MGYNTSKPTIYRKEVGEKMVDTNKLRGVIVSKGLTQEEVATRMGISSNTFYRHMREGVFSSREIEALINILGIDKVNDAMSIFFAEE